MTCSRASSHTSRGCARDRTDLVQTPTYFLCGTCYGQCVARTRRYSAIDDKRPVLRLPFLSKRSYYCTVLHCCTATYFTAHKDTVAENSHGTRVYYGMAHDSSAVDPRGCACFRPRYLEVGGEVKGDATPFLSLELLFEVTPYVEEERRLTHATFFRTYSLACA